MSIVRLVETILVRHIPTGAKRRIRSADFDPEIHKRLREPLAAPAGATAPPGAPAPAGASQPGGGSEEPPAGDDGLDRLAISELRALPDYAKIRGGSRLSKADLLAAIRGVRELTAASGGSSEEE